MDNERLQSGLQSFDGLQRTSVVASSGTEAADLPLPSMEDPVVLEPDRRSPVRIAVVVAGIILVLAGGIWAVAARLGRTLPPQASNFGTVRLPLSGLETSAFGGNNASSLKINGTLRVTDSLVLKPIAQPDKAETGQLFYNQLSNQLAYYNGREFVNVGGGTVTNNNNVTNVSNITNALAGTGAGVQLQQATPGVQQAGNFNVTGTGVVGKLQTTVIDAAGGTLYVNPLAAVNQQVVAAGTPVSVGVTSGSGSAPGPGWANDLSATKVTLGGSGGTASSISAAYTGGSAGSHIQVSIYDDDGNVPSKPANLLAQSAVVNMVPNGTTTVAIPAINLVADNTYWLAVNTDDNTVGRTYNGGSKASCFASKGFGFMPDPFGGCFYDDNAYTISLNYTAGAGTNGTLSQAALVIGPTGQTLLQNSADSTTAFRVQNAAGTATLLDVDTVNGRVGIGKTTPSFKLDVAAGDVNLSNGHSLRFGGLQVLSVNAGADIVSLTNFSPSGSISTQASNFLIQDANATTTLFKADAAALRIYIGDPAGAANPVVLYLANKTTAGDPVGAEGGTYYNATLHSFRCFFNGAWHNCSDIEPQHGFSLYDEFVGGGTSFAGPIGSLAWNAIAIGANGSLGLNPAVPAPSADRPGVLGLTTTAVANQGSTLLLGDATGGSFMVASGDDLKTAVATSAAAGEVLRIGLHGETSTTAQPVSGVWLEANPAVNANWRYCYGDGSVATCAATSVAIAANAWVTLEIRVTATGAGTSAVTYVINNTPVAVSGVTIDTAARVSPALSCFTTGAAARSCFWDYFQLTGTTSATR